ncbi:MAG TPA: ROK family protein [Steroidobacteraceae bacterium]|nr:ROK family protein [Steroidobacteraceae bacterium]
MSHKLLGIDVGGSFIKAGMVDIDAGLVVGELISAPTPQPSSPEAMMPTIASLAARLPEATGRVGLAFPAVVKNGRARTAANVDHAWIGADGAALIRRTLNREALFLNDADAAGLAEMRLGAGRGVSGSVIMLTFGTGIGSALFVDGRLFPNTELGHMELNGMDSEKYASAHVKAMLNLDWRAWMDRVNEYLDRMQALFWPDLFILGGAISERFADFAPLLHCEAQVRPAQFGNQAGVLGAALAAAEADLDRG